MIVLDTHAWVWWASEDKRLSRRARRAIEDEGDAGVAAISVWEVASLVAKGRLKFDRDVLAWVETALAIRSVSLLPLEPVIAVEAARLRPAVADPSDALIVATALAHGARLVTKDERIRKAALVDTVW